MMDSPALFGMGNPALFEEDMCELHSLGLDLRSRVRVTCFVEDSSWILDYLNEKIGQFVLSVNLGFQPGQWDIYLGDSKDPVLERRERRVINIPRHLQLKDDEILDSRSRR